VGLGNGLTMPAANARVLSLRPGLVGTASGLAAALTVIGAGVIASSSGLVVNATNAAVAVLGVMLTAFIAKAESAKVLQP
jgi:MFS transporter, DHA1 family, multidrug resistance protein